MKKIKERNINIDLIKFIAILSVISVHFFLNSEFYTKKIDNIPIIMHSVARLFFTICVPLFLITTGYLMKNKEVNKKYYFGILRTYITYLIITSIILLYFIFFLGRDIHVKDFILGLLSFDVGYCWYIEMYMGMFIFMPFLNVLYNNINCKKTKLILIITMMCVTVIPVFLNTKFEVLPHYWTFIYPTTYYFIGCYLREYKINYSYKKLILYFLFFLILGSVYFVVLSYGKKYVIGDKWNNLFTFGMSVFVFIMIINLNLEKLNFFIKRIIIKISELSLGMYLSSYIVDDFFYKHLFSGKNLLHLKYYFIIVPLVFLISFIISYIVNLIYQLIDMTFIKKIEKIIVNE